MDGTDITTAHGLPFEYEYLSEDGAPRRGVPANEELSPRTIGEGRPRRTLTTTLPSAAPLCARSFRSLEEGLTTSEYGGPSSEQPALAWCETLPAKVPLYAVRRHSPVRRAA